MKMDKAILPTERTKEAIIPSEEASQPMMHEPEKNTKTSEVLRKAKKRKITFENTTEINDKPDKPISQSSSNFRQALSQPAPNLSHKERLLWLQRRRSMGLWAQCDDCKRWRFLADVLDSHELPDKWFCRLNPDRKMANCLVAEEKLKFSDEEELIHNEYSAGSLVWARMQGWPWWPAMVDDCPDTEQFYWLDGFSDIPTYYNVVFFDDEATRAWIAPENLQPYNDYSGNRKLKGGNAKKHQRRLQNAIKLADQALNLQLPERLAKFSFIARYPGHIKTPQKMSKAVLEKYQRKLQRKYNIAFPLELEECSELRAPILTQVDSGIVQTNSVNILVIPKKQKARRKILTSETNVTDMIQDSLIPVESQVLANDNDGIKKPEDHIVDPNSMSVQLNDSNIKTSLAYTAAATVAAAQSTYCEQGEANSTTTMETNIFTNTNAKTEATCDNDDQNKANSTQSEPMPLIRIPTATSDDFDF